MTINSKPFNISLLKLNETQIRLLSKVTTLDRFKGGDTTLFHPEGLYSSEIFGRVGESQRDITFAVIDLKTSVFHPIIYERIGKLKSLYIDIITSKKYATWNEEHKIFEEANVLEGETGYSFFVSHWKELKFSKNESSKRNIRIELIEKFRDVSLISHILVMPAGLRDINKGSDGRIV